MELLAQIQSQLATILLILVTLYTSLVAARNPVYFNHLLFKVDRVRYHREYYRLLASGFVHLDWLHLAFNLLVLYMFGSQLEAGYGWPVLLLTHFLSIVGGSLLALWFYRDQPDYSSGGASGGIAGVIFASVFLFPDMRLGLLLLPIFVPGWLFALAYVGFSLYAAKRGLGFIGYMAHVGGGMTGALIAPLVSLSAVLANWWAYALLWLMMIGFLIYERRNARSPAGGGHRGAGSGSGGSSFFRGGLGRPKKTRGKVTKLPLDPERWRELAAEHRSTREEAQFDYENSEPNDDHDQRDKNETPYN